MIDNSKTSLCNDTRKCFAKNERNHCTVLEKTYEEDGDCPFAKPIREVTGRTYYPYVNPASISKKLQEGEAV